MELENELRTIAESMNASFYGVADLAPAKEAILAQGGPMVADFPRAISVGIALMDAIVDQLPQRSEPAVSMSYRHHCYEIVNQRLDHITSRLSSLLQHAGHRALPVPGSQSVDNERLYGIFSNKMAAHLAGLGWIGKSCLLVTPQVGPRARWATVLTDAPLTPNGEPMAENCGDCCECVDICPASAFSGRAFRPEEPREARFDVHKCEAYFDEIEEKTGLKTCGMCLYVCPYGRN
jgi:epoxyqueuosine reductase QueG